MNQDSSSTISRFDCLKPKRKPQWARWQIGEEQLLLPDTKPFSDHIGISFACFHCGTEILKDKQIHQLKVGAIWSNCLLPATVFVSEEAKTNPVKKTTFFEVFCLECKRDNRKGSKIRNIGAAYYEKYRDSETNDWVPDKVFPCIKFVHVFQHGKMPPRNNLVLVGRYEPVELAVRGLQTTELLDRNAEAGILRPALTQDTYQRKKQNEELKKQNEELSQRIRQSEGKQSTQEKERLELAAQVERLKQQGEKNQEKQRQESKRIDEERHQLDLQIEQNNTELAKAREALVQQRHELDEEKNKLVRKLEHNNTELAKAREALVKQRHELDEEKDQFVRKLEFERQELEFLTQQERLRREEAENELTSATKRFENHIKHMVTEHEKEKKEFDSVIANERKKLDDEKQSLLEQLAHIEEKKKELELRAEAGPDAKAKRRVEELRECDVYRGAEAAFKSLGFDDRLLDRCFDRCYCRVCYPDSFESIIKNDGPKPYVVPRNWVRFGLKVPAQADVQNIWKRWCVSFHGTKHSVAKSVVRCGDFLMPGDKLPDGTTLGSVNCAGRTDKFTYTSPTVNYAGLAFYAHPEAGPRGCKFQVVFQCRQKPDTFEIQGETMGFRKRWNQTELCPHVRADAIEWISDVRKTIIPYGVLLRTFPAEIPPTDHFRSPVDNGRF